MGRLPSVEKWTRREVLQYEFLNDLHAHIGVINGLYTVANTQDKLALFAHLVYELHWVQVGVVCLRELSSRSVQGASKSIPLKVKADLQSILQMEMRMH